MSRLMEKLATRAWKKNIDVIDRHPEYRKRLEDDKIIDYKRELKGFKKGTKNIKRQEHIKVKRMIPLPWNREREITDIQRKNKSFYEKAIGDRLGVSKEEAKELGKEESKLFKNVVRRTKDEEKYLLSPSKGFITDTVKGTVYQGDIGRKPSKHYRIALGSIDDEPRLQVIKNLHEEARKDRLTRKFGNAINLRHEIDEKRALKRPDAKFQQTYAHNSPRVIERESKNIAGAPSNIRSAFIKMREPEQAHMASKGFQYGASGKDKRRFK